MAAQGAGLSRALGCESAAVEGLQGTLQLRGASLSPSLPNFADAREALRVPSALIADPDRSLASLGIPGSPRLGAVPSSAAVGACAQAGLSSVVLARGCGQCLLPAPRCFSLFQPLWVCPARSVKCPASSLSASFHLPCCICAQTSSYIAFSKIYVTYQILS